MVYPGKLLLAWALLPSGIRTNFQKEGFAVANIYCCDLGFNWNAVNKNDPNRQGKAFYPSDYGPLQASLINKTNYQNVSAFFTQFKVGDSLFFVLYDLTTLENPSLPKAKNQKFTVEIEIQNSDLTSVAAPLSPAKLSYKFNSDSSLRRTDLTSTAYGGQDLVSYVLNDPESGQREPLWYTLHTPGHFELTVTLGVENEDGTKRTFIFDPEMIVGPST